MANTPLAEITILGQRISLKPSEQNQEAVREVIDLVTSRIRNAETRLKKNSAPHQVAVLALLDLAEQYVEARRKTQEFKVKMSEKAGRLIRLLEEEKRADASVAAKNSNGSTDERGHRATLPRELSLDDEALQAIDPFPLD